MFEKLITESAGKSPWLFHINAGSCNGCDIELVAVLTEFSGGKTAESEAL